MTEILFNPEDHSYFDSYGREYASVTKICHITEKAFDFSALPSSILERAIEKGNRIHKDVENYIKSGFYFLPTTRIIESEIVTKADFVYSEVQVYDDRNFLFAGRVDLIAYFGDEVRIYDIKSGSHSTVDYQLSLYKRAFCYNKNLDPKKVTLWLIDMKDEPKISPVFEIPSDTLDLLLDCYFNNKPYSKPLAPVPSALEDIALVIEGFQQKLNELKAFEDDIKTARSELARMMREFQIKNFETEDFIISYTPESTRQSLDNEAVKRFLAENGKDIAEFKKSSVTAESVRFRRKK